MSNEFKKNFLFRKKSGLQSDMYSKEDTKVASKIKKVCERDENHWVSYSFIDSLYIVFPKNIRGEEVLFYSVPSYTRGRSTDTPFLLILAFFTACFIAF